MQMKHKQYFYNKKTHPMNRNTKIKSFLIRSFFALQILLYLQEGTYRYFRGENLPFFVFFSCYSSCIRKKNALIKDPAYSSQNLRVRPLSSYVSKITAGERNRKTVKTQLLIFISQFSFVASLFFFFCKGLTTKPFFFFFFFEEILERNPQLGKNLTYHNPNGRFPTRSGQASNNNHFTTIMTTSKMKIRPNTATSTKPSSSNNMTSSRQPKANMFTNTSSLQSNLQETHMKLPNSHNHAMAWVLNSSDPNTTNSTTSSNTQPSSSIMGGLLRTSNPKQQQGDYRSSTQHTVSSGHRIDTRQIHPNSRLLRTQGYD